MEVTMLKAAIFLSIISTVYSVCKDFDTQACTAIHLKLPDMCKDPCISVLCSDTCNNCPLKCFKCDKQLNPEDCKTVVQCQAASEVCIAVQTLTQDYIPLYTSGCESRDVCLKVFGNINIRRSLVSNPSDKRSLTLKGGCCDVDKCNVHDPENEPTERPGYVRTTLPSDINPTYRPDEIICTGSDLNATACATLQALDPNICSKHCVAQKLCQGMCKTCVKCFKCEGVLDLSDCTNTDVCKVNQKCVNVQQLDDNFVPRFRMGCMDGAVCAKFFGHKSQAPVGKRQFSLNGGCCSDSLCNNQTLS